MSMDIAFFTSTLDLRTTASVGESEECRSTRPLDVDVRMIQHQGTTRHLGFLHSR